MSLVTCLSLPRGSAWANMVSQYTQVILLVLYMWWRKIHVKTWGGTVLLFYLNPSEQQCLWHCHQQVTKGLPPLTVGRCCSHVLKAFTVAANTFLSNILSQEWHSS